MLRSLSRRLPQLLYGIAQDGLLLVGKFDGVVDFGCTVCHGDFFRALRGRHYRLDTKNLTSSSYNGLETL